MRVIFLGTGTSHGVPAVGCTCAVCRSDDPRNHRSRPSALVAHGERSILIDTAPELRLQALRHHLRRVDAVLFTHAHADHVAGLDDLRSFNFLQGGGPIPCYGNAHTMADIARRFHYALNVPPALAGSVPHITCHVVDGAFDLFGLSIVPVPIYHGRLLVYGYRLGDFAYVTDCNAIPPASMDLLRGLDVLVIDALRYTPHPTHFTIPEALDVIAQLRPRRAYLTHITHEVDHATTSHELPPGVELAYDGLTVTVGGES
jgi:phosphoribosyl 1,2-cyclic phosphate phosphodiesterase